MSEEWQCGACGEMTTVRHFLQRDGVMAHDVEAAYREASGLDEPEPSPPGTDGAAQVDEKPTPTMASYPTMTVCIDEIPKGDE